jgi:NADH-quinone oxidoreductase subunit N
LKYLVLAGATSSILLFGIALIYPVTGTMDFSQMSLTAAQTPTFQVILLIGWGMLLVGLGFKLSLVPFQLWAPDVYEGAPLPITTLIATISKGSVFALMLRYFTQVPIYEIGPLWTVFAVIAIASMLYGNILALIQNNLKRILAYSSIAHLGYMLVAFLASGSLVNEVIAFYLAVYFISSLVAFGVMTLLSRYDSEMEEVADYTGLFWRHRWLAVLLATSMFSLAGIPPFAGAIGKIFLTAAGVQSDLWLLLIVLVVSSIIGVFYYIRVALTVFRKRPEEVVERAPKLTAVQGGEYLVMAVLFLLLIGFGLYPTPLLGTISQLMSGLAR